MLGSWRIKGELILNCSCTVFCPCVVSLGEHPPTEGRCQGWFGVRIGEGHAGASDLSGLKIAAIVDIPGPMARGNWTVAAFIDERANESQFDGLIEILSGKAKGTTGVLSWLVGTFLGAERAAIDFTVEGRKYQLNVGKKIIGEVEPIPGADEGCDVRITNSRYWMASEITVAKAIKSRVRAFGRVWNFEDRSAEICQIDWKGP